MVRTHPHCGNFTTFSYMPSEYDRGTLVAKFERLKDKLAQVRCWGCATCESAACQHKQVPVAGPASPQPPQPPMPTKGGRCSYILPKFAVFYRKSGAIAHQVFRESRVPAHPARAR